MKLWAQDECGMKRLYPGHHCSNYSDCPKPRDPTPAELLEAARPHADLEAAEREGRRRGLPVLWQNSLRSDVKAIVDAALGADNE